MEETARCLLLILLTLSHILKERIGRGKPGSKYDPAARTKRAQTALRPFLAHMPPDTGMVFVMVQHLDPRHPSMLVDVLVTMRVTLAKNGEKVAANRVYIIPPDATLTIENGTLQVTTPASPREHRRPIDTFLPRSPRTRASAPPPSSCRVSVARVPLDCVRSRPTVASLAQAEFDVVDYVVAVEVMPEKHRASGATERDERMESGAGQPRRLATAFEEDRCPAAPGRRSRLCRLQGKYPGPPLQRRMQVLQLDAVSNDIARLAADPHEADLLFRELLIGVTEFFRNPEASQRRAAAPGHQNVAICFSGRRKG